MRLTHITLEHFRNYTRLNFALPSEPWIVLEGENGQGKTNFLEAVYMLALTKSFRTNDRRILVQFDEPYVRICGEITEQAEKNSPAKTTLELAHVCEPRQHRGLKKNKVSVTGHNFIGQLKVVLFRPEDIELITGEPSVRRRYLNNILIQTEPVYLAALHDYTKILHQRNALLHSIREHRPNARSADLEPWDIKLAEAAEIILKRRYALIDFLQNQLHQHEIQLQNITLRYEATAQTLYSALESARSRDIAAGCTTIGPHRDDFTFESAAQKPVGQKPTPQKITAQSAHRVAETASRGELRGLIIALKRAEIAWIQEKTDETPIILLDDVFSELDANARTKLIALLPESAQVIMTTTDSAILPNDKTTQSRIAKLKIREGTIHR